MKNRKKKNQRNDVIQVRSVLGMYLDHWNTYLAATNFLVFIPKFAMGAELTALSYLEISRSTIGVGARTIENNCGTIGHNRDTIELRTFDIKISNGRLGRWILEKSHMIRSWKFFYLSKLMKN